MLHYTVRTSLLQIGKPGLALYLQASLSCDDCDCTRTLLPNAESTLSNTNVTKPVLYRQPFFLVSKGIWP